MLRSLGLPLPSSCWQLWQPWARPCCSGAACAKRCTGRPGKHRLGCEADRLGWGCMQPARAGDQQLHLRCTIWVLRCSLCQTPDARRCAGQPGGQRLGCRAWLGMQAACRGLEWADAVTDQMPGLCGCYSKLEDHAAIASIGCCQQGLLQVMCISMVQSSSCCGVLACMTLHRACFRMSAGMLGSP